MLNKDLENASNQDAIVVPNFSCGKTKGLKDTFNRSLSYLRLSITDICNFSCEYCLPNGYSCNKNESFLSVDEIGRMVRAFAELGIRKIRITGGEPTIRKDFHDIAKVISSTKGIEKVAFTTNGYRLKENAQKWRDTGISAINVSVDSLNPETFHKITGHNRLNEVLDGIKAASNTGFDNIKVNAVLLKGINDSEFSDYLDWAKRDDISIRFIELMETNDNRAYFRKHHLSSIFMSEILIAKGWTEEIRSIEAGPAKVFTHADYRGTIGIIAPYSKDFCKTCNRLRTTARGDLRLCLFGEYGIPLRPLLQSDNQGELLKETILNQLQDKRASHFLHDGETGITQHLASVGG